MSRLTPDLRRMIADEVWTLPTREDVAALIASRDQFERDLAKARADRDSWQSVAVERVNAAAERDRLWMLLEAERGMTGSVRLHAEALKRVTAFGVALKTGDDAWAAADYHAGALLAGLRPQRPQGAPQPHAPGLKAASAQSELFGARAEPQRPVEGSESCRKCRQPFNPNPWGYAPSGNGVPRHADTPYCRLCVDRCHESTDFAHSCVICHPPHPDDDHLRYSATALTAGPSPFQPVLGIVVSEETARTGVLPGSVGDVLALSQAPDLEGALAELRTSEQWCDKYDLRIYDPDGWRSATDPRDWDQPITLAEFERRTRTSTVDSRGGWNRMNADLRRAAADTRPGCPDCGLPETDCACG